ncbi:uncharacterized protein AMSG_08346 [Thecamonas trahens ATCC 50062]|uniref:Uncharacterized protein n=1 Tax=Thecamonas trahens ATCC 50062 TaxID=461836 RepID=A0A0L0DJJ1_THETB|nr:hypothetical protein AMSG_08346 [Thecamonas trahens ATCC 50062]KNC52375.1 hypothetical protein AMSG_08346 [Thecamonas trahens ATCC 50062]|eukprot:XP_013755422.1 hypothetical protein AMSG_08346 [Thecamonas trahens ATCC 50062]
MNALVVTSLQLKPRDAALHALARPAPAPVAYVNIYGDWEVAQRLPPQLSVLVQPSSRLKGRTSPAASPPTRPPPPWLDHTLAELSSATAAVREIMTALKRHDSDGHLPTRTLPRLARSLALVASASSASLTSTADPGEVAANAASRLALIGRNAEEAEAALSALDALVAAEPHKSLLHHNVAVIRNSIQRLTSAVIHRLDLDLEIDSKSAMSAGDAWDQSRREDAKRRTEAIMLRHAALRRMRERPPPPPPPPPPTLDQTVLVTTSLSPAKQYSAQEVSIAVDKARKAAKGLAAAATTGDDRGVVLWHDSFRHSVHTLHSAAASVAAKPQVSVPSKTRLTLATIELESAVTVFEPAVVRAKAVASSILPPSFEADVLPPQHAPSSADAALVIHAIDRVDNILAPHLDLAPGQLPPLVPSLDSVSNIVRIKPPEPLEPSAQLVHMPSDPGSSSSSSSLSLSAIPPGMYASYSYSYSSYSIRSSDSTFHSSSSLDLVSPAIDEKKWWEEAAELELLDDADLELIWSKHVLERRGKLLYVPVLDPVELPSGISHKYRRFRTLRTARNHWIVVFSARPPKALLPRDDGKQPKSWRAQQHHSEAASRRRDTELTVTHVVRGDAVVGRVRKRRRRLRSIVRSPLLAPASADKPEAQLLDEVRDMLAAFLPSLPANYGVSHPSCSDSSDGSAAASALSSAPSSVSSSVSFSTSPKLPQAQSALSPPLPPRSISAASASPRHASNVRDSQTPGSPSDSLSRIRTVAERRLLAASPRRAMSLAESRSRMETRNSSGLLYNASGDALLLSHRFLATVTQSPGRRQLFDRARDKWGDQFANKLHSAVDLTLSSGAVRDPNSDAAVGELFSAIQASLDVVSRSQSRTSRSASVVSAASRSRSRSASRSHGDRSDSVSREACTSASSSPRALSRNSFSMALPYAPQREAYVPSQIRSRPSSISPRPALSPVQVSGSSSSSPSSSAAESACVKQSSSLSLHSGSLLPSPQLLDAPVELAPGSRPPPARSVQYAQWPSAAQKEPDELSSSSSSSLSEMPLVGAHAAYEPSPTSLAVAAIAASSADDVESLVARGTARRKLGLLAEAKRDLHDALKRAETRAKPVIEYELHVTELLGGELTAALECLDRAMKVITEFEKAGAVVDDAPQVRVAYGDLMAREGRDLMARAAYDKAIRQDPECGLAHLGRGKLLHSRLGKPQAALTSLKTAAQLLRKEKPDLAAEAFARIARILASSANHTGAIDAYLSSMASSLEAGVAIPPASVLKNLARSYGGNGDYESSREMLDLAVAHYPGDASVFYLRGCLRRLCEPRGALTDLSIAITLAPGERPRAYFNRALVYVHLKRYPNALADYKDAVRISPKWAVAHVNIALVYMKMRKFQFALDAISAALDADTCYMRAFHTRAHCYLLMELPQHAVSDYTRLIHVTPDEAPLYVYRARALILLGKKRAANIDYATAVALHQTATTAPTAPGLLRQAVSQARLAMRAPRRGRSRIATVAAEGSHAKMPSAFLRSGRALLASGKYEQAVDELRQAVGVQPNSGAAHVELARGLLRLHKVEEAVMVLSRGIAGEPSFGEAWHLRGLLRFQLGYFAAAKSDFDAAIAADPDQVDAYLSRAVYHERRGETALGIRDCLAAIAKDPTFARAYVNLGALKFRLGHIGSAVANLTRAIRLQPRSRVGLYNRGAIYHASGVLLEALADYTAVLEAHPTFALAYRNRGLLYYELGLWAEAVSDLNLASALLSNSEKEKEATRRTLNPTLSNVEQRPRRKRRRRATAASATKPRKTQKSTAKQATHAAALASSSSSSSSSTSSSSSSTSLSSSSSSSSYSYTYTDECSSESGGDAASSAAGLPPIFLNVEANIADEDAKDSDETSEMFQMANVVGECLVRLGRTKLALVAFTRAHRLVPHSALPLFGRAEARLATLHATIAADDGRRALDAALCDVQRGLMVAPDSGRGYALLGRILQRDERVQQGWQAFSTAVVLAPKCVEAWYGRALLLLAGERFQGALMDLNAALKVATTPQLRAKVLSTRGVVLAHMGVPQEAEAEYAKAIKADPRCHEAAFNLAGSLYARGEVVAAVEQYRAVVALWPADAVARNNTGVCLASLGELEAALSEFDAALAHDPQGGMVSSALVVTDAKLAHHIAHEAELAHGERSMADHAEAANDYGRVQHVLAVRDESVAHLQRKAQPRDPEAVERKKSMRRLRKSMSRLRLIDQSAATKDAGTAARRRHHVSAARMARIKRGTGSDPVVLVKRASQLVAADPEANLDESTHLVEAALNMDDEVDVETPQVFGDDDVLAYDAERHREALLRKTVAAFRHLPRQRRLQSGMPLTLLEKVVRMKRRRDKAVAILHAMGPAT